MSLHYPPRDEGPPERKSDVRSIDRAVVFLFGAIFATLSVLFAIKGLWVIATVSAVPSLVFIVIALIGGRKAMKFGGQVACVMEALAFLT